MSNKRDDQRVITRIGHKRIDPGGFGWIVAQPAQGTPEPGRAPVELGIVEFAAERGQDRVQLLVPGHQLFPSCCRR